VTITIVTGTGTDVGKTVATAALAACAKGRVAVVKPAQTGVGPDEPGDLAEVTRLSRVQDTYEFVRYRDPLSPHHAAVLSATPPLDFADTVRRIDDLDVGFDHVLVEGAGGLTVPFDNARAWTVIDLAQHLHAGLVVVTSPGLGTLNHTRLTVDRLADEALDYDLVLGSWPPDPDLAMRANLADLQDMTRGYELAGVLPAGMAAMRDFRKQARAALGRKWGGTFDSRAFVARHHP
jgi:dethiobiotin synthetase